MSNEAFSITDFSKSPGHKDWFVLDLRRKSAKHKTNLAVHFDGFNTHQLRLLLRSANFRQAGYNGQMLDLSVTQSQPINMTFFNSWIVLTEAEGAPHYIKMNPTDWAEFSMMVEAAALSGEHS